ncbi:MAG TPA: pilus assembly PilX N-terminal domain-containing protein [Gemmatimonadaceae bacterium]|nr:pilus assembly PilX N-terminal domain-containing protein [Gemmatimonadaceae bacterium]
MRRFTRAREGFALAIAIFAIVVIGTLIGGIFFASMQQQRMARNQRLQTNAIAAAEYGLNRTLSVDWKGTSWNTMPVGGIDSTSNSYTSHGATARVRVTRIGNSNIPMFLVSSEGASGTLLGARARRRTSSVMALVPFDINLLGALTTRGALQMGGSSFINGTDTNFSGWGCPATGPDLPGVATGDSTLITTAGCNNWNCVQGSPPIQQNAAASDTSTYFDYGNGIQWAQLTAMAKLVGTGTVSPAPLAVGGVCQSGVFTNWGDPARNTPAGACEDYFPILYSPGNLNLLGGRGQGILLVEGNLNVAGGFQFYGPIIVRGDLNTQGTGGHFNGGVMAANVNLAQNVVLGNAVVTYSSCIMAKVQQATALPIPMVGRPWAELY